MQEPRNVIKKTKDVKAIVNSKRAKADSNQGNHEPMSYQKHDCHLYNNENQNYSQEQLNFGV